jgi:hypothetical protein
MNVQIVLSLLAVAISFLDAEIAVLSPKGGNVSLLIDVKQVLGSAIAMLRGDTDASTKLDYINEKVKAKKVK